MKGIIQRMRRRRKGLGLFYYYKVVTLPIQIYYPLKSGQNEWMAERRKKWKLKTMHQNPEGRKGKKMNNTSYNL